MSEANIGVMYGDFIGPEVMAATLPIVRKASEIAGLELEVFHLSASAEAYAQTGNHLPDSTIEIAEGMDAVLKAPFGGPKDSDKPVWQDLERNTILPLRERLGLYANLRPVRTLGQIGVHLSPLKEEGARDRDLLIVRELTGDAYFGKSRSGTNPKTGKRWAYEQIFYGEEQVERIVAAGIVAARNRGDVLTLAYKTNVLKETGGLWLDVFNRLTRDAEIQTDYRHIDDTAAAILRRFTTGTIVTSNMFGDILSDENVETAGSIGLGASASLGDSNFGLYEPVGGSAPDIEDVADANPVGMILSAAMMFRHTYNMPDVAGLIEQAVEEVLNEYYLTKDLMPANTASLGGFVARTVNAAEFSALVLAKIEAAGTKG